VGMERAREGKGMEEEGKEWEGKGEGEWKLGELIASLVLGG